MGMLLDPVADKLLIAAAFITLVQFNPRIVPAWMAVIIIGREFLVSGLRSIAASEGFTIQASDLGKLKMLVQIVSVVAAIIDHHWAYLPWYLPGLPVHPIALVSIWVMVGLSLWSAADYFVAFWKQDRPDFRAAPPPAFLCAEPAQEAQRCPRNLNQSRQAIAAGDRRNTPRKNATSCCCWRITRLRPRCRARTRSQSSQRPSGRVPRAHSRPCTCRASLRGCIGYVFPNQSLYQTVAETARAAAFDDPRFEPVTG